ncbi:MAG: hypothetical protein HY332_03970 [Chloroflexi bacterium]|nr:hypothetical protein [Chloroflexota bacterium]
MIGPLEVVVAIVVVGGPTWVISKFIDKAFGGKQKQAQMEAKLAHDRTCLLEAQLIDAHRQNEQLQQQLEWHTKMLES